MIKKQFWKINSSSNILRFDVDSSGKTIMLAIINSNIVLWLSEFLKKINSLADYQASPRFPCWTQTGNCFEIESGVDTFIQHFWKQILLF